MPDRSNQVAVAGLVALAVAMGIGRFAFTPILPMMQADAGLGVVQGGWLASANYAGYLAGGLSAVALGIPAAHAIRIALVAVALSTLAMGLTSSLPAGLVLRFVAGVASAWVLVFTSAWCLERFQHDAPLQRRGILGATLFAGVGIGIALAGAICALLATVRASSNAAWIALGVVALLAALAIWRRIGSAAASANPGQAQPARWNAESLRMIGCYGAFGFGYIIPATFLATMAREAASEAAIYAWSWPAFGAAAAASTFAAALLGRELTGRTVWIVGHLVMAAGVVVPLLVGGLAGIVLSALLVGGTFMVVTMAGIQEARRIAGAHARPLIAAMTSAFAIGQIAGPLLVAALASRGMGYAPALLAAGALLVVAAAALVPISSPRSPP